MRSVMFVVVVVGGTVIGTLAIVRLTRFSSPSVMLTLAVLWPLAVIGGAYLVARKAESRRREAFVAGPTLKLFCGILQGVAAVLLFLTVIAWFYTERRLQRPEASYPSPERPFTLYVHDQAVFTSPVLGRMHQSAPYICTVLILIITGTNSVTRRIRLVETRSP